MINYCRTNIEDYVRITLQKCNFKTDISSPYFQLEICIKYVESIKVNSSRSVRLQIA